MTGYRINLHAHPGIDSAIQAAVLDVYHAPLEHDLGVAEALITACHAWQDVMLCSKLLFVSARMKRGGRPGDFSPLSFDLEGETYLAGPKVTS